MSHEKRKMYADFNMMMNSEGSHRFEVAEISEFIESKF